MRKTKPVVQDVGDADARPQEGFAHIMYTAHMDDLPILIVLIMKNSFYSERYSGDPLHSILSNNVKVILKQTLGNLFLHELIYCYK